MSEMSHCGAGNAVKYRQPQGSKRRSRLFQQCPASRGQFLWDSPPSLALQHPTAWSRVTPRARLGSASICLWNLNVHLWAMKRVQANEWLKNMSRGRGCFGLSGCKMSIHKKQEAREKKNQEGIMKLGMGRERKRKRGPQNLKQWPLSSAVKSKRLESVSC